MKLKELRLKKGLSQSQLADETGISVRIIQHYEQGSRVLDNARIDTILKFCVALDCKISEIIENAEYLELLKKVNK